MIPKKDLGPPRRVHGWAAVDKELARQCRLVESGDLRSIRGETAAWWYAEDSDGVIRWSWVSKHYYQIGDKFPRREDRDVALAQILKPKPAYPLR